jgi:hypothetical protein
MPLTGDKCLGGLALGIERVEGLFQTFFGRLPCIDGTVHCGFFDPDFHWTSKKDLAFADWRLIPKNSGPDYRVPVMRRAISERLW